MKRRPRFLPPAVEKPDRVGAPTWLIRTIAIAAIVILLGAVVVSVATGTLFTTPSGR